MPRPSGGTRAHIPAETQAEAFSAGSDLVLGFDMCEAPCILTINAQHPVAHCQASLCSFASRSELWGDGGSLGCKDTDQTEVRSQPA